MTNFFGNFNSITSHQDFNRLETIARNKIDKFFVSGVAPPTLKAILENMWHVDFDATLQMFRDIVVNKEWKPK